MAYYLLDDQFADDVVWDALSGGRAAVLDAIQAAYARLCSKAAHLLTDGYLTEQMVAKYCSPRALAALCRPVLGRPPRLHRPGDECECLGDAPWVEGYAYRIHKYLRRNPSRSEHNRNKAQKADLKDARLKGMVFARDGGCCRYCRSGTLSAKAVRARDRRKLLHFDHVDPDQPAGADGANLVTSCARCNEHKGHRTPDEADMVLLPAPTAEQVAQWRGRDGQVLYEVGELAEPERSGSMPDQTPITDESPTDQRSDQKPVTDRNADRISDQNTDQAQPERAETAQNRSSQHTEQAQRCSGKGAGAGRGGDADPDPASGPPDTPRSPDAPDVYHGRSRPGRTSGGQHYQDQGMKCLVCLEPIHPAAGRIHPACEDEAGWPAGATPAGRGDQ